MDEQRSAAWFEARKERVTASEVGAILGLSPFQDADDVMRRKVRDYHGAPSEFQGNIATRWGTMHESGAIIEYEMETGNKVTPTGFYEYENWFGASPDGLVGEDGLIEVKCPFGLRLEDAPVPFKTAKDQMHYWAQIQVQLHVTQRKWCDFFQWTPKGTSRERVLYDGKFVAEILPKLKAFWERYLVERENPGAYLEERKIIVDTPRAKQLMAEYDDICVSIEKAEERKKELIEAMVEITKGANAEFAGRNLTLVKKAGAISYAKAIKELLPGANLEPWRGKPSEYWVVK